MLDKPRILSLFPNSFNRFNKTSTHAFYLFIKSAVFTIYVNASTLFQKIGKFDNNKHDKALIILIIFLPERQLKLRNSFNTRSQNFI